MSIIQHLRERSAWIITVAIAIALLTFVIQEGLNRNTMAGSDTELGEANGKVIDRLDFEEKFKRVEDRYSQMGYNLDDAMRIQQKNALWNDYVDDALLEDAYKELGFEITDKEIGDMLYGPNPPQDFRQRFTDPNTQQFDPNLAYQTVQKIKNQKNSADYRMFFGEYIPALVKARLREKYEAMMSQGAYAPKWMIEKMSAENSQAASISYINASYLTVPDSSVKVSDEEIKEYVSKNKSAFKQEKSASVSYVYFNGSASAADSARVLQSLTSVKDSFLRTSDVSSFILYSNSQISYYDSYISKKEIKTAFIDSIINNGTGSIYGPYIDGGNYVMARVVGTRNVPDTVKVRHILIATRQQDPNSGQTIVVRSEDDAKKLADSIELAVKSGSVFDTLCARFSDDGNRYTGGIYEGIATGRMVAPFNDFIFTNLPGSKGVVKTEFGYHYVEVLSHKGSSPGYKIAYVSRPILTSDETVNGAMGLANQFAGESRTAKQLEENAAKKKYNVLTAAEIKPLDAYITGINGNCREIVRWIFNDAEKSEVSERPFTVGTSFVVPVVTAQYEEGTMDAEKARPLCEFKIRQQKKAKAIASKAANAKSLEEAAALFGTQVFRADSISFGVPQIPNVGFEPKVVGAAFNKENQSRMSAAITGESGVFFIKTENLVALPNPNLDVSGQQNVQKQQIKSFTQRMLFEYKRKAADITDNRYRYF